MKKTDVQKRRKFEGKNYRYMQHHFTKKNAKVAAGVWRRAGFNVRIIKTKPFKKINYEIYVRKKNR